MYTSVDRVFLLLILLAYLLVGLLLVEEIIVNKGYERIAPVGRDDGLSEPYWPF